MDIDAMCEQFDLAQGLAQLGYDRFRPGQQDAVEALLQQRRLLLIAPTGGGKSLCYQLPAVLLPGTTVVVSPLIALMNDQVQALHARGIEATYLASTLDSAEMKSRMARLRAGAFKIVYVAPERLQFEGFRALLKALNCPLIAVDEAHCISEWGHDFRPEYMRIGELIADFPEARILACTATATPVVRDEILGRLGLSADTPQIVRGFARPNLALRVQEVSGGKERHALTDALLAETLKGPGARRGTAIIYAPTRKATEEEAARLVKKGWRADAYHAGMDGAKRERVQGRFTEGALEVAVATNAFGMGIDRADVRAVLHLAPPGSIEAYYQEVGRAGRDGEPAVGLLLTSPSDMPLRRSLLERPGPDGCSAAPGVIEHKWNLFLELMRWAEGGSCRHDAILRYFGDEQEALQGCGKCDVCGMLADGAEEPGRSRETVTLMVRKALSGVARVHGRFGLKAAAQLLRGAEDDRLKRAGLDRKSTFGILNTYSEAWLMSLLRRCVTAGWIDFVGGDRPMAILTDIGRAVMKGEAPARLLLPLHDDARAKKPSGGKRPFGDRATGLGGQSAAEADLLDEASARVFEALRRHRLDVAREAAVPPFMVASDRTLRDLAMLRPRNTDELQMAHGIGPAKVERYGAGFLRVISAEAASAV